MGPLGSGEMLTGTYPFDGDSPVDWLRAEKAAKFIPLAANLPEVPHVLKEFFERVFAVEPACGFSGSFTQGFSQSFTHHFHDHAPTIFTIIHPPFS